MYAISENGPVENLLVLGKLVNKRVIERNNGRRRFGVGCSLCNEATETFVFMLDQVEGTMLIPRDFR